MSGIRTYNEDAHKRDISCRFDGPALFRRIEAKPETDVEHTEALTDRREKQTSAASE